MDEITELFKPVVYKVVQLCANKYGFNFIEAIQYIEESNQQKAPTVKSKKLSKKAPPEPTEEPIQPQKPRKLKLVVGKDRIMNHTSVLDQIIETARKDEQQEEQHEDEPTKQTEDESTKQTEDDSTKQKEEEEPTKVEIVKYKDSEYYVMEGTNYAYTTDTEMYVGIYNWSTKSIEY